ncbi:MAG: twin-arginine translocation signal domain-containing protein [Gammaproteobacteria bacterium]|nr:twin-arginine translocation signal domain-containing protein [Gammaproteobacteria bacterium]
MHEWEKLKTMLAAGSLSRRDFLRMSTALGISTALAGTASKVANAAAEPKRGGHLVVGVNGAGPKDSLDPATYTAAHTQITGLQLYSTLVEFDVGADPRATPSPQPSLAESWEAKPGAKEWVFKLRKGVTFHNGKSLTPADVVYSLNHHRGADSMSSAKVLLRPVSEIKAGKNEVIIKLESGNVDLPSLLADYHLCIGPDGSSFTDGIGTGAFILENFEPGVRAITKRNPNFFRKNRGFVDSVETLAINDPVLRLNALTDGSVHLINSVDIKYLTSDVDLYEVASASHYCFPMRCDVAPFDDKDLRLALKYAIDRQAMLKTVLLSHGRVGNDNPIAPSDAFYSGIPQRPYDPEKAKFHLKKSGYAGALVLSVSDGAFSGAVDCARIFQVSAGRAGIKLQLDIVPAEGYWDNVWMKRPFCASYWYGRSTADLMFSVVYQSDATWNETRWKRPDFDKLLVAARAELDTAKRRQMYGDLQMMVHDDGGEIIPMFFNMIDAGSKDLRGFVPLSTFEMSGFRAPEKVWLET